METRPDQSDDSHSPSETHPPRINQQYRNTFLVGCITLLISVASTIYLYNRGMTNVYGDGVAHLNIARKVVDNSDPGLWRRYIQIGSPWLPLQTVLMLPLVANDTLWRTGLAGSLISMACFVLTAMIFHRISIRFYSDCSPPLSAVLPFITVAIIVLSPSVLYMQATPMTELVFMLALAFFVLLFQRWVAIQTTRTLIAAGAGMSIATLTRYESWPVMVAAVVLVALASRGSIARRLINSLLFAVIALLGPAYWLWHNWAVFGDAFEFVTGPSSARGIYLQNRASLGWANIFAGHALLDILLMIATVGVCAGFLLVFLTAAGLVKLLPRFFAHRRPQWPILAPVCLLTIPFLFHMVSIYRGEVQLFPLAAFGLLNVRYGLPHILAIALVVPALAMGRGLARPMLLGSLVVLQYVFLLSEGPAQLAVFQEGFRNGVNSRPARDIARASSFLLDHPPPSNILMNSGELGPLVSRGGLQFSNVIHEGSTRWYSFTDQIPADIATVIYRDGDVLGNRLAGNSKLKNDLDIHFSLINTAGGIKIFERVSAAESLKAVSTRSPDNVFFSRLTLNRSELDSSLANLFP